MTGTGFSATSAALAFAACLALGSVASAEDGDEATAVVDTDDGPIRGTIRPRRLLSLESPMPSRQWASCGGGHQSRAAVGEGSATPHGSALIARSRRRRISQTRARIASFLTCTFRGSRASGVLELRKQYLQRENDDDDKRNVRVFGNAAGDGSRFAGARGSRG